jgi:hypothetical protein
MFHYSINTFSFSRLEVEMTFRTFGENGLLLYGGAGEKDEIGNTDFIVISIVDRFIEFSFDLGGGAVVLRSMKPVTLGIFLDQFYLYGMHIFHLIDNFKSKK